MQRLPKREGVPFSQKLSTRDPDGVFLPNELLPMIDAEGLEALDLLERMLVFDPRKRIDAAQSLSHPYIAPHHDPSDEPVSPQKFDWSFNDAHLPVNVWMSMTYNEILGQPISSDPSRNARLT